MWNTKIWIWCKQRELVDHLASLWSLRYSMKLESSMKHALKITKLTSHQSEHQPSFKSSLLKSWDLVQNSCIHIFLTNSFFTRQIILYAHFIYDHSDIPRPHGSWIREQVYMVQHKVCWPGHLHLWNGRTLANFGGVLTLQCFSGGL